MADPEVASDAPVAKEKGSKKSANPKQNKGDNPNKTNAQGRKNYRPMTRNVVKDTTQTGAFDAFKFADPLEYAAPTTPEHPNCSVYDERRYSVQVDIWNTATFDMAAPFADITVNTGTVNNQAQLSAAADFIPINTLMGTARAIYSAGSDAWKSEEIKMKGVYYYPAKTPSALDTVTSIYGDFKSKLGLVGIKFPHQRFLQIVNAAVALFANRGVTPYDGNKAAWRGVVEGFEDVLFNRSDFLEYLRYKVEEEYERRLNATRQIQIAGAVADIRVRPPVPGEDEAAYQAYLVNFMPANEATELAQLAMAMETNVDYAWFANAARLPLRNAAGIRAAAANEIDAQLAARVTALELSYETSAHHFLNAIWEMTDSPAPPHGAAALTVEGPATPDMDERSSVLRFGMSDSDAIMGSVMQPARENGVEIDPQLRLMLDDTRSSYAVGFASRSMRALKLV